MLNKLIASSGDRFGWLKHPWVIGVSIVVHALLLGGFLWLAAADAAEAAEEDVNPEDITYIDVSEVPPPPEVEEPEPEPEPPQQQQQQQQTPAPTPAIRPPRVTPPAVTQPDRPAGFQELRPPREALGVPPPRPSEAVRAEDFGGRGTPGGVAGGNPPPPAPPSGNQGGEGTGGSGVDPNATYTANAVDRIAELRDRSELPRTMRRLYPSHLRDAGVGGRVVVQFVVTAEGRVEGSSVRVLSAAHPELGEQTRRAVADFRFRPAQKGSRNVRQLVQMAIDWQPAN